MSTLGLSFCNGVYGAVGDYLLNGFWGNLGMVRDSWLGNLGNERWEKYRNSKLGNIEGKHIDQSYWVWFGNLVSVDGDGLKRVLTICDFSGVLNVAVMKIPMQ